MTEDSAALISARGPLAESGIITSWSHERMAETRERWVGVARAETRSSYGDVVAAYRRVECGANAVKAVKGGVQRRSILMCHYAALL